MPGTGAYLLQQQQQQQQQQQARGGGNRNRRGNQTQNQEGGSASVPPPSQAQPANSQATPVENINGEGKKRSRPPRHRNRPASSQNGLQRNMEGGQPLSRVPTNGSTAGSNASASNAGPGNRRGQGRNRGFNAQLTDSAANGEDGLDPSAGSFVPGDRGQKGRNGGHQNQNQGRRGVQQGHNEMDQPPHMTSASASAAAAQYQIQDQQNQARSRLQPVRGNDNRRNARTRKPFQGNLSSSSPLDFEEMQERAVMGGSIPAPERKYRGWGGMKDEEDGLVSKLVRGLGGVGGNWLECVICFSTILPQQPIWSCSPTTSTVVPGETSTNACCYTPFHLSCIKDWSSRSLLEAKEKARDRDTRIYPEEPILTWRCPGCQKRRIKEANRYECYCGKVKNLSNGNPGNHGAGGKEVAGDGASLVLPHSCGNSCSRDRSYCGHPCPLQCHVSSGNADLGEKTSRLTDIRVFYASYSLALVHLVKSRSSSLVPHTRKTWSSSVPSPRGKTSPSPPAKSLAKDCWLVERTRATNCAMTESARNVPLGRRSDVIAEWTRRRFRVDGEKQRRRLVGMGRTRGKEGLGAIGCVLDRTIAGSMFAKR